MLVSEESWGEFSAELRPHWYREVARSFGVTWLQEPFVVSRALGPPRIVFSEVQRRSDLRKVPRSRRSVVTAFAVKIFTHCWGDEKGPEIELALEIEEGITAPLR